MNIIELAREVGMLVHIPFPSDTEVVISIERFAALVRAQALEEAAGVCEEVIHPWGYSAETPDWERGTEHCAAAIRALKEKT